MSLKGELQLQNGEAWVELFELDLSSLGGPLYRFVPETNGARQPIVWQGNIYNPLPIAAEGFAHDGTGRAPRPKLRAANPAGVFSSLASQYGDFLRAKVVRKRTKVKYLDVVNFPSDAARGGGGNMLDLSGWVPGSPPPSSYRLNGSASENSIVQAQGPFGNAMPIWRGVADGGVNDDGGWDHTALPIDPNKTYRFSVWVKPVSGSGNVYLGTSAALPPGGGAADTNPYFAIAGHSSGSSPLTNGNWYLVVGYRFAAGHGAVPQVMSGIYDGATKARLYDGTDWQSLPGDTAAVHRAYQYYASAGAEQWFAYPRMEVVDGSEPSIASLLLGAANPTADPDAYLDDDIFYVTRKSSEFPILELELGSPMELPGVSLPRRQIIANSCAWRYRSGECGYAGGPVANEFDQPTSNPTQDKCSHTVNGCKLRFGANAELPFGGFPGAAKIPR